VGLPDVEVVLTLPFSQEMNSSARPFVELRL